LLKNPTVLLIGRSEETQEVLQTALNKRGVSLFSAKRASDVEELNRRHLPDLIVLDLEKDNGQLDCTDPPFWAEQPDKKIPVILLGTVRRRQPQIPGGEFVSKPYHFGPLVRKIEELLSL
jgi:DNA-binding response OmpR family regulator